MTDETHDPPVLRPVALPDPRKVKVQLNIPISYEMMTHLNYISDNSRISKARLIRAALETVFPLDQDVTQEAVAKRLTRNVGLVR